MIKSYITLKHNNKEINITNNETVSNTKCRNVPVINMKLNE